jgi:hypothetical protein
MSIARFVARACAVASFSILVSNIGCSSSDDAASSEDEAIEGSTQAYSGVVPDMNALEDEWNGAPKSWAQPESEGVFGLQNFGYCGATAAANLLRWYGREVTPRKAIDDGCWSWIGTRPKQLAYYLQSKHADLGCQLSRMTWDADALKGIRNGLRGGRPFAIVFMTGALNAHWVTVVGVEGEGRDPKIIVASWGRYYWLQWSKLQPAWRNSYNGPYPFIMCRDRSPHAGVIKVDG